MKSLKMLVISILTIATLIFSACSPAAPAASEVEDAPAEPETVSTEESATEEEEGAMDDSMDASTIVDIAVGDEQFSTLVTALQAAGLAETLAGEGPFTVFAPTNDAFANLPEGALDELLADPSGALTNVLLYHVVEGEVMAADVVSLTEAPTLQGSAAPVTVDGETVMIGDATVTTTDIEASNGVIHIIDTVLVPSEGDAMMKDAMMEEEGAMDDSMDASTIVDIAVGDEQFSTLVTALQAAGLAETLAGEGPFTVFAPTNDAFANLPEGALDELLADPSGALTNVLLYHVVEGEVMAGDLVSLTEAPTLQGSAAPVTVDGEAVMIGDATVTTTDIEASNGVIHIIDAVLVPSEGDAMMEDAMMEEEGAMDDSMDASTIVDIAVGDEQFSTLVTALQAAGLAETLAGEGPFTVFAPTNEAFANLPEGTLDELLADPSGALTNVLLYHVVEGEVMAADVVSLTEAPTLQGSAAPVMIDGETVMIGDATVTTTDIEASNGVIHIIDAVLTP